MIERWSRWPRSGGSGGGWPRRISSKRPRPSGWRAGRRRASWRKRLWRRPGSNRIRASTARRAHPRPRAPPALDIEGHERGLFQAQDEAAQLVSLFAAPERTARILDACAAPGGKACHLAEIADKGSVLAVDLHARKASSIAEAAQRLGLGNLEARAADAMLPIPDAPFESFDLVLLDAPCSGLGTLRRHPEVKLRRTPEDVDRLAQLQAKLLASVQRYVRPGGLLVQRRLHADAGGIGGAGAAIPERVARSSASSGRRPDSRRRLSTATSSAPWPHRTGTDGFFAARLRRTA